MSDYFDQQLREDLAEPIAAGQLRVSLDVDHYFGLMKARFPIRSLRPDWQKMPFRVTEVSEDRHSRTEACRAFLQRRVDEFRLTGDAVYVGDGCTDIAVSGDLESLLEISECLFSIPQHHYVLATDQSWFMCLMMEGDMGFGFFRDPGEALERPL